MIAQPLKFNSLSLDDPDDYQSASTTQKFGGAVDSEGRLMEMLAAQAAHRDGSASEDEDAVASNEKLSESEKKETLQKGLNMAASNGDMERIEKLLKGKARNFVDPNAPDEEGTAPIIYASCFVSFVARMNRRSADECGRAMRLWLQLCLRLVPMSTSKIGTSGVL